MNELINLIKVLYLIRDFILFLKIFKIEWIDSS